MIYVREWVSQSVTYLKNKKDLMFIYENYQIPLVRLESSTVSIFWVFLRKLIKDESLLERLDKGLVTSIY